MVPTQVILEFMRLRVGAEVATEVVIGACPKILVPDTVDVVSVGGLGDVNLILINQLLELIFVFFSPGLEGRGIGHGWFADLWQSGSWE
jgi:hypothetical protein